MAKIYESLTELTGHTPLVHLNNLEKREKCFARVLVKLESFNPLSSVKDRVGLGLIEDAERRGLVNGETVIIEPTSGNTGIALAWVSACRGYRLILTMPESMSVERRKLLKLLGAELVLTPASLGMKGAIDRAEELKKSIPNSYMPMQFENPANPETHYCTTAREIQQDTDGAVDIFVAGVGTGGTLTGVARYLKEKNPALTVVAVEPFSSQVIATGVAASHKIQGIGANFVPKVLELDLVDRIYPVKDADAMETAKQAAKCEGMLVGISSGAALFAALNLAKEPENAGKTILAILPDTGERYLSTELFD